MYINGAFMKELYLAGGPYYGLQEVFSRVKGVARVRAGFANCSTDFPSKEDIYSGKVEGRECIQVIYNPKKIDIVSLLSLFFTIINPYTDGIQGKAEGPQFRSGVYYTSREDTMQISYYLTFLQNRGIHRRMTDDAVVFNAFEGEGGKAAADSDGNEEAGKLLRSAGRRTVLPEKAPRHLHAHSYRPSGRTGNHWESGE